MTETSFQQIITEIEKRGSRPESPPTLDRMKTAMELMGFFDWPFWKKYQDDLSRIVVVAGTNGKGSTSATLDALLRDAGESVGFYSSPHLVHYTERIRWNGSPISEDVFIDAYNVAVKKTSSVPLTHFELLTLMALWCYCSGQPGPVVDRLVLEVGLGGLWDATNAVPHGAAVITKLGLDHVQILGPTLSHVARNKLGVIPYQGIVVHHPFPPEAEEAVQAVKMATRCRWIPAPDFSFEGKAGHPPEFHLGTSWGHAMISLSGRRGAENSILALQTFEALGFSPERHLKILRNVKWSGRMEKVSVTKKGAPVYFSGDHNPQGIESLLDLLPYYPRQKLHIVCGIGKDKDRDGILNQLFSLPSAEVYLTQTPFRGLTLENYGPWLKRASASHTDPEGALRAATEKASPQDMILITGSFYLMESVASQFSIEALQPKSGSFIV